MMAPDAGRTRSTLLVVALVSAVVGAAVAWGVAGLTRDEGSPTQSASDADATTGGGAGTPEDAIRSYLDAFDRADADGLLEASSVDQMAQGFDFSATVERMRSLVPWTQLSPTEYEFYRAFNQVTLESRILGQARMLAYGLLSSEDLADGTGVVLMDLDRALRFVREVDPGGLAEFELVEIGAPDLVSEEDPRYLENATSQAGTWGAGEMTERVALVAFGDDHFAVGFTLLRYESGWGVMSQTSVIAGFDTSGLPAPTTPEEFGAEYLSG